MINRFFVISLLLSSCACNSGLTQVRAQLELDPLSLDFGSLAPGASKKLSLTLTSRGARALSVSSVSVVGDAVFTIVPLAAFSLPSGASRPIEVSYAPQVSGAHAARLIILSDASETPEAAVPLIGTAQTICRPVSCASAQKNCGALADGCGAQLDCGTCTGAQTCLANVCTCTPETDAALCTRLSKTCGALTAADNCSLMRTVTSCGSCTLPSACSAANVCVCTAESDAAFCSRLSVTCGPLTAPDQCGNSHTANCGVCPAPNWTQRLPSLSPPARGYQGQVFDSARNETVIFGGMGTTVLADTWVWNGATWTQRAVTGPPARRWHSMAYDSARQRTVLFGGTQVVTNQMTADTWEWDGATWLQRTPASSPPKRYAASLTYDSVRQRTVLFGGVGADISNMALRLNVTWEWDGTNWLQRSTPTAPTFRDSHAAAFDSATNSVILFGGYGGTAQAAGSMALSDTWAWNGMTWALQVSPSPAGYNMRLAFDALRSRLVRFGGNYPTPLSQTWEWDGATWTQLTVSTVPPARAVPGMSYDSARRKIVLFGGEGAAGVMADTWEFP